jgi:hypothetical protein
MIRKRVRRTWIGAIATVMIAALLLCAVAFLNRAPLVFDDTRAYWVGGKVAAATVWGKLDRLFATPAPSVTQRADGVGGQTLDSAVGVRSAFYSLFVYLSERATPLSFWGTILLQGLVAAYLCRLFFRCVLPGFEPLVFLGGITVVAVVSSMAWVSSQLMPDLFTGVVILGSVLLALYAHLLTRLETALLLLLQTFAISTHTSHFAIAVALFTVALALSPFLVSGWQGKIALGIRLGLPISLAVAGTLVTSFVGFGKLSLTPQSPPFLLARSLADGPARQYLQQHCPTTDYVMCRYMDRLPADEVVYNLLWAPDGVYLTAPPAVRDRLRREELPLLATVIGEYPLAQLKASVGDALAQLTDFGPEQFHLGGTVYADGREYRWVRGSDAAAKAPAAVAFLQYGAVILAAGLCGFVFVRRADLVPHVRPLIVMVLAGVFANAAVCGALSEPVPRYQARIAWLLPLLGVVLTIALSRTKGHRNAAQPQWNAPNERRAAGA